MKTIVCGLLFALSINSVAAQQAPATTHPAALAAARQAQVVEDWETAEANYAVCLKAAPADITALKDHAYAAANCLERHPNKPLGAEPDYLSLAVQDYDALVAAGQVRYLLDKAAALGTRAEAIDKAERPALLEQALVAVREYEEKTGPTNDSMQIRGALLEIKNKAY